MTETVRRKIAEAFRAKLDAGVLRKAALLQVRDEFPSRPSRASVYRYCKRFGISVT